mmetsp:Transcript_38887/g.57217  ORF Transcript_38887/g.57217 Transcript_38887/m.57217 type:complete len:652 (+) Transcript_38887:57-2012(+)
MIQRDAKKNKPSLYSISFLLKVLLVVTTCFMLATFYVSVKIHDKYDKILNESNKLRTDTLRKVVTDTDANTNSNVQRDHCDGTPSSKQAISKQAISKQNKDDTSNGIDTPKYPAYLKSSKSIRSEFASRYGGESNAIPMLSKGIITFPPSKNKKKGKNDSGIQHTAKRILRAIALSTPFVMAFGGYSVTAGRGNYFNQSFPFVVERILTEPFHALGIDLISRNAAIGGIPSLPYGFCQANFLGKDADLVSWDFGMNEGVSAEGLETYLRHSISSLEKAPMFVLLDTNRFRRWLLQHYVDRGMIVDPIAVQRPGDGNDLGIHEFLSPDNDEMMPLGFQDWNTWGAPPGAPGQAAWHPKYKEHELLGWMIAMHLLKAMDVAVAIMNKDHNWKLEYVNSDALKPKSLGKPNYQDSSKISSLLHGTPQQNPNDEEKWTMNTVSCRTSFRPGGMLESSLVDIVTSPATLDLEPTTIKSDEVYAKGWVLDIGQMERNTKQKLITNYGPNGLGYIDMKLALYGVPQSGTLSLWLSLNASNNKIKHATTPQDANKYIKTLIICEVNEKRGDKECNMKTDVTYKISDRVVTSVTTVMAAGAAYLKKPVCVHVDIPKDAKISTRDDGKNKGVMLDVTVTGGGVTRANGACSISHVVWEEHT